MAVVCTGEMAGALRTGMGERVLCYRLLCLAEHKAWRALTTVPVQQCRRVCYVMFLARSFSAEQLLLLLP